MTFHCDTDICMVPYRGYRPISERRSCESCSLNWYDLNDVAYQRIISFGQQHHTVESYAL